MRALSWLAAIVLFIAPAAEAQPRRFGGGPPLTAERRARMAERREQIKKKIRAMRAYTLTEELGLDERTAARLFPALGRYDDESDKLLERRVDLQYRLRQAESLRDPRALDRLIDEAVANQRSLWDLEDRRVAELRKILTPAQTARLLVVLPALERKIERQLRRAVLRRAEPPSGPGGVTGDDIDDAPELDDAELSARPDSGRGAVTSAPKSPGNTPP
jgi:hypothetical protein